MLVAGYAPHATNEMYPSRQLGTSLAIISTLEFAATMVERCDYCRLIRYSLSA